MKPNAVIPKVVITILVVTKMVSDAEPLRCVRATPLHVEGRNDHLAADAANKRVFLAALGNKSLEVVDVDSGKVERSIRDLQKPQGIVFLKLAGLFAVATGDDGACHFFDTKSLKETASIETHEDSDNVRFDPVDNRIYVGFGEKKGSGGLTIIDVSSKNWIADIDLGGHPESF
jgi:DNA-binding beta-propeller fold protein YncE